jgi:hypothetical protein
MKKQNPFVIGEEGVLTNKQAKSKKYSVLNII